MKTLTLILILLPLITTAQLYGEYEIGLINDRDGFTYIRDDQELKSNVIDTLVDGEFFYFTPNDSSDWCAVYKMWNVNGFVHKSRIKSLKSFTKAEQRTLIDSIFSEELKLYSNYFSESNEKKKKATEHHEEKFSPILNLFISYMEKNYDELLMRKFFEILIVEFGSADEIPPLTLGYIYLLHPNKVIELVKEFDEWIIYSHLEYGFANVIGDRKEEIENFDYLEKQILELTKNKKK